jgi:hypothetical protein
MPSDAPTLVSRLARAFIDHTSADGKDRQRLRLAVRREGPPLESVLHRLSGRR